jgi:hypothetical protein
MIQEFFVHYLGSELSIILTFVTIIGTYLYLINRHFVKREEFYQRKK